MIPFDHENEKKYLAKWVQGGVGKDSLVIVHDW